jgi:hypothetical protein
VILSLIIRSEFVLVVGVDPCQSGSDLLQVYVEIADRDFADGATISIEFEVFDGDVTACDERGEVVL